MSNILLHVFLTFSNKSFVNYKRKEQVCKSFLRTLEIGINVFYGFNLPKKRVKGQSYINTDTKDLVCFFGKSLLDH